MSDEDVYVDEEEDDGEFGDKDDDDAVDAEADE